MRISDVGLVHSRIFERRGEGTDFEFRYAPRRWKRAMASREGTSWRDRPDVSLAGLGEAATAMRADHPVDLFRGPATLDWRSTGKVESLHLTLTWHWEPTPSIYVSLAETPDDDEPRAGYAQIRINKVPGSLRAVVAHHSFTAVGDELPLSTRGLPYIASGWLDGGELGTGPLRSLQFGILNFPSIQEEVGETAERRRHWQVIEHPLDLIWSQWRLTLTPRAHDEAWGPSREAGRVAITHVGRLNRLDGGPFETTDARLVLDGLRALLTFARGERCGPGIAVGGSVDGGQWSLWDLDDVDPMYSTDPPSLGWMGEDQAAALQSIVGGWMRLWSNDTWRQTLDLAVALRTDAAARRPDVGIVVAQQAMEQLSWSVLVEDEAVLSREGFTKLPAADRIRLALANAGVPLDLPDHLLSMPESKDYDDGPHALTSIRNGLVHPPAASRITSSVRDHLGEWRDLALQYIDLLVLDLVGEPPDDGAGDDPSTAAPESVPG
jgi:hypothetical protein